MGWIPLGGVIPPGRECMDWKGYLRGLTADAAALRDRERMESRKAHDENPIGARMVKCVEPEIHPNGAPGKLARLRVWSQNGAPGKFARLMVWSQRCTRMVHLVI